MLDLSQTSIGAAGMRELAGALKGLTDLRLAYNRVEAEGGTAIAKMLRDEGHAGLSRLDMGGCRVGPEAGLEIAKALGRHSLHTLRLAGNLMGDQAVAALADALRHSSTLTLLDLADNTLSEQGATRLAEVLGGFSALRNLSVKDNAIGGAGALQLVEALRAIATLSDLGLGSNGVPDKVASHVINALPECDVRF